MRASLQSKTVLTDVFLRKNMGMAAAAPSNIKKLKAAPSKNKKSKKLKATLSFKKNGKSK